MKILDRYILITYLKTFFSVFIILMLIFVLQSVWLYINELAGKDLELDIIAKFLIYVSPRIIVLVLPLTILLSSIMVFGSFAENYEFAAMKSTGISLQRAMRGLGVFIFGLSIVTFFFANNVIPTAEFNFYNLRKNIAKKKPAMAIAKGQFNQIGDLINIKVKDKSGDRGQYLEEVIVHKKKNKNDGNHTVIIAETGELISHNDSDVLELILYNGHYNENLQPKDYQKRTKNLPSVKSTFEKNIFYIDLAQMDNVDFENKDVTARHTMLNINELDYTIDSLKTKKKNSYNKLAFELYASTTAPTLNRDISKEDINQEFDGDDIIELYQSNLRKVQLINYALSSVNTTLQTIRGKLNDQGRDDTNLNKHIISYYEKFALAIACIILFFIGAPLGALIKKGGIGLPIVIAIVLFLTYHFIGIFAKNSAEDSSIDPVFASWLSTMIMLPLSIYLTNRATKDRALFELDSLLIPIKSFLTKEVKVQDLNPNVFLNENSSEYKNIKNYSDKKLIDIVKNYRQYDMDVSYRNSSIKILNSRGITEEELRFGGNLQNENYENALRYKINYTENSALSFKLYFISLFLDIIGAVLNNNGFPTIGITMMAIGAITSLGFLIYLFRSFISLSNFYKLSTNKNNINIFALMIIGIPLYFLIFYYYKNKLSEDLKQIR
ncbi:LptF/LptG family permease [Pontimicrobium sp. SW4]|uniref:LptF/LptG family permease n=1 Tax=Pontimicrobium sp. SW4 TaxID=3153519 RepID=A0AAU7BWB3_9FLAO